MKIFFCYFLRNNYSHNIIISKYTLFQIQNCGWRSVNFKMSFWRLQSSQKKQEYFVRISALASRKRSNQKSSVRESKKKILILPGIPWKIVIMHPHSFVRIYTYGNTTTVMVHHQLVDAQWGSCGQPVCLCTVWRQENDS